MNPSTPGIVTLKASLTVDHREATAFFATNWSLKGDAVVATDAAGKLLFFAPMDLFQGFIARDDIAADFARGVWGVPRTICDLEPAITESIGRERAEKWLAELPAVTVSATPPPIPWYRRLWKRQRLAPTA